MNVTEAKERSRSRAAPPPEGTRSRRFCRSLALPLADGFALSAVVVLAESFPHAVVYALAVALVLAAGGRYRLRICMRNWDQLPRIAVACIASSVVVLPFEPAENVPLLAGSAMVLIFAFRAMACAVLKAVHRGGAMTANALVIGTDAVARRISLACTEHPEYGLRPCGFLERQSQRSVVPVVGDPARAVEVIRQRRITHLIVCFSTVSAEEMVSLLRACRPLAVDVCVVPRLHEVGMALRRGDLDELWGIPLIPLRGRGWFESAVKRAFDLTVGTVALVLVTPALVVLALLVRVRSGRVIFRQLRVTRRSRFTEVAKFRTVVDGASECWTVRSDQCTGLGRWLRATHLDELPQLFNVLRGDMSLVGPRPERPRYAVRFAERIPGYADRHRMPGGITGWAQIHDLHGDTSIPDRARFDNQYIEYWSPWMDLVIVVRTVWILLMSIASFRPEGGKR